MGAELVDRSFKDFYGLIDAVLSDVAAAGEDRGPVICADDVASRRVGWAFNGSWYHGPVIAISGRKFSPEWEQFITTATGRRVMAMFLTHGHRPDGSRDCPSCLAWVVLET